MSKLDLDYFETIMAYKSLTDGTYLASIVDYVEPGYFANNDIKEVFKIVAEFYTKRGTTPSLSEIKSYLVTPELKASFKNAVKLFEGISPNLNSDELYANTERFLKEKAVYTTMMKTVEDFGNNKIDTSEILQRFEKSCSISLTHDMGIDLHKDFNTIRKDIEQDQPCISTGWKWLDGKIGGGFRRDGRAIYIFAGETNVGKSIVLGNAAVAIAKQNKTVLIVSLEMPETIYAKRLYSNISKIPISNLKGSIDALKKQIDEHAIKNPEGRILIKEFPPSTITANHLKGFIKKLTSKGIKLDAIVVDYVNLLHSTIGSNSYERVKYSTEQLRALTYEFKCPIITATQLNRCLDIQTKIITADGLQKRIDELQVGEKIKGSSGDVVVRHIYPHETQKCYKITTKSGKQVVCSERHLFPTVTGNIKSIQTGLKEGDRLLSLTESSE
jgi:replicative DNA helicase